MALPGRRVPRLFDRLRQPQASIEAAYQRLAEAPRESVELSRAAEWLLDNHYIVRRALRLLREQFPASFERRLPRLSAGPSSGLPRIYAIAAEIAAEGKSYLDVEALRQSLRDLQAVQALTIAEVWALPTMLRLVVLERLASVMATIAAPAPAEGEAEVVVAVIAACIRHLRDLETTDWNDFVESISAIEAILEHDPAGVYGRMDFATRDSYRKAVEDLAAGSRGAETDVASRALELARAAHGGRAAHVGFHLVDQGRRVLERDLGYRAPLGKRLRAVFGDRPTATYIGGVLLVTLLLLAPIAATLAPAGGLPLAIVAAVLAAAPASAVAIAVVNGLTTRLLQPCVLPKMDFESGIPQEFQSLVAVPSLVTSVDEIATLVRDLEIRYLANEDPHLLFALLTDFADAPQETMPEDDALVAELLARLRALNERFGGNAESGPFHLLHRPRRWCDGEGCWMGWERKRGKLSALDRLIAGGPGDEFSIRLGDAAALRRVRFVITLDADTELPRGAASRLVATLAHPLNRAEVDASGRVVAGYTVLQPRVEISPLGATSRFARLFSAGDGLDPYTRAVSDAYQDLFAEGIFAGKGIYDVATFDECLEDRVPDGALLSHDLFEGVHGRAGLVSDVILFEDYPDHYLAYTRRLHRWARGDWQLLPWLGRQVPLAGGGVAATPLSLLSRWKILDNLRRTLVMPSLLAFLVLAWIRFPTPLPWTALAFLVPAAGGLFDFVARALVALARPATLRSELEEAGRVLRDTLAVAAVDIAFLPHQAAVLVDAAARTLWRLYVSRTHLLEWRSAAHTARAFAGADSTIAVWTEMAAAPAIGAAVTALLAWARPQALIAAAPLLLAWLAAPAIASWISRPRLPSQAPLGAAEILRLRLLARRTWAFFETFGGPEDQWLPPDHFQEDPRGVVARRTSPTNIGLLQLATLCAYDFGYRDLLWVALRLKNVFDTIERMERYRGHLLNWYSTATLEPLLPRYVSTVDSGNLVGCMIAVGEACGEFVDDPIVRAVAWEGFLDTLNVLGEAVEDASRGSSAGIEDLKAHLGAARQVVARAGADEASWDAALSQLTGAWSAELDRRLVVLLERGSKPLAPAVLADLRTWSGQVHRHLERMQRHMDLFAPWAGAMAEAPASLSESRRGDVARAWEGVKSALPVRPSLRQLPGACLELDAQLVRLDESVAAGSDDAAARAWIAQLRHGLQATQQMTQYAADRLREIRERAGRLVAETDFALVYDARRRLFHIGYNVAAAKLDEHHYDLLASEARLASFIAIAKGDVPEEHWLHLGRPIGDVGGERSLISWSGTMFEYLMPPLLLREGDETLIGLSCRAAVREQIDYARARGTPWGISESGYSRLDAEQNYQYRAFGVPSLGFRRGLEDELVVAPYASVLAVSSEPRATADNVAALRQLGMSGAYGLYESVDFTWSRLPPGRRFTVVRSFMAHHQGMIIAALDNYLNGGPLVRRFHAAPMARTAELLLFERPAHEAPVEQAQPAVAGARRTARQRISLEPWRPPRDVPCPQVHVLSNGRLSTLVTDSGGGYGSWDKLALTRWTADPTLDEGGFRIFVRDGRAAADSPLGANASPQRRREVLFHPYMVEFHSRDEDVFVRESVAVATGSDMEIRYLTLTNEGDRRRRLNVAGYGEVVLQDAAADRRHPAFSKMFVESEFLPELNALLFHRRRRDAHDREVWLLHMLVLPANGARRLGHETSRENFLGRGGSIHSPAALAQEPPRLSGTVGTTLDPVMVLAAQVDLQPHRSRQLAYVTLVAESREAALALAAASRSLSDLDWAFEMARNQCEVEMSRLGMSSPEMATAENLLSLLLYGHPRRRAANDVLERNTLGRSGLWRFAVSGDLPILVVRLNDQENVAFLHEVLRAQSFWRGRGVAVDLVILNERASSYSAELTDRVGRAVSAAGAEGWLHRPGGVFVVHADQASDSERTLLLSAAHVVLEATAGSLAEQIAWGQEPAPLPPLVPTLAAKSEASVEGGPTASRPERPADLLFDNGLGGFTADGREYVIHLEPGQWTPAPWVNVVANPGFGFVVSESGSGYTWARNSGENRLTPWSNDPVADPAGEALYLRDEETGDVWSPTPLPARAAGPYQIRHGAGYSEFLHASHDLEQKLRLFAAVQDPVKLVRLELTNLSDRPRRLTATYYVEWVLGTARDGQQGFLLPAFDGEAEALLAHNPAAEDFADGVAFLAAGQKLHGFTADRGEFLGRIGRRARPAALSRIGLANAVRAGLDPCAALQLHVDLAPHESKSLHFILGQGRGRDEALRLARAYRPAAAVEEAWDAVREHWDRRLGAVTLRSPSPAIDVMLNRWLLYQTTSSRLWGRTGFYQSSGAYGFRDQLQDVAALLHAEPQLCRAHLLEAARHQFEAGDVLHWWHPPADAGIRSRCSDDLLWLPYITALYVRTTGDAAVLREEAPFLRGDALLATETERYARFDAAEKSAASLYEHCLRAIRHGRGAGPHGLPLFGSGDWNDGMNRVGALGRGESVWLGWFRYRVLEDFAAIGEAAGHADHAADLRREASSLRGALEAHAWDGAWYLRGFYDDGSVLGSAQRNECRIDSMAQSWAVLSGAGEPGRARAAMEAVRSHLFRDDLTLLFTPPFNDSEQDPGYIRAYPPGVRENGGQYTHAAMWALWALAELGDADAAVERFEALLPMHHSRDRESLRRYRVEPYALAADVYGAPPFSGRGGWTWYTGSAAWAYRFGWEKLVGLRLENGAWRLDPCVPRDWPSFEVTLRHGAAVYEIRVDNSRHVGRGVRRIALDGAELPEPLIPRVDDGAVHRVDIALG